MRREATYEATYGNCGNDTTPARSTRTAPDRTNTNSSKLSSTRSKRARFAPPKSATASWEANEWVKQGILLNFGLRNIEGREYGDVTYHDVLPLRRTDDLPGRGTRNTPDGTVLRRGAHVGSSCILMSPEFVNIGVVHRRRDARGLL